MPILILNGLERLTKSLFSFQFCGKSNFNQSARGSFGDSLAELDTSVGVGFLFLLFFSLGGGCFSFTRVSFLSVGLVFFFSFFSVGVGFLFL